MGNRYHQQRVWILIVGMTLCPAFVLAQPSKTAPHAPADAKAKINLDFLTPDTAAAMVLYPQRVLAAPQMDLLPIEALRALVKEKLGIDPADIEQTLSIAEPEAEPAGGATVLHLTKPLGPGKILAPLWDRTKEAQFDGKTYRRGIMPMDHSIFRVDDRTVVVASEVHLLQRMLRNHARPKAGPMTAVLARVAEPPDVLVILLPTQMPGAVCDILRAANAPPAAGEKFSHIVASIEAKANLRDGMSMSLAMRATNEVAAQELEGIIEAGLIMAEGAVSVEAARQPGGSDPVEQALAQYAKRASERIVQSLHPVRKGETLTLAGTSETAQMTALGVLMALSMPIRQADHEPQSPALATDSKEVASMVHDYLAACGQFPFKSIVMQLIGGKPADKETRADVSGDTRFLADAFSGDASMQIVRLVVYLLTFVVLGAIIKFSVSWFRRRTRACR